MQIDYVDSQGAAQITRTSIGTLNPKVSPRDVAEMLINKYPDTPLLVDQTVAAELSEDSVTWLEDDHFSLQGVSGGAIEVYTPYASHKQSLDFLPPNQFSTQVYDE